tara:strand:+ start:1776 stop:2378 length:603 start_codon:yes stop_codon:yes gene_type:complete
MLYQNINSLVPHSLQRQIESALLYSDDVRWAWRDTSSGVEANWDTHNPSILETPQWQHDVYDAERGILSELFQLLITPLYFLEKELAWSITAPQRIKANLLTQHTDSENKYHPPHIDLARDSGAYSMVYYVNDSDGETVLFDRTHRGTAGEQHLGLEEIGRTQPKGGSCTVFPSNRYHSSSSPVTTARRCIVNYVFLVKE